MTATYPNDAIFSPNSFSTISSVQYATPGSTRVAFALGFTAKTIADVLAYSDGVLQDPGTYYMDTSIGGGLYSNVTFYTPPNSTALTLKTISLPSYFYIDKNLVRNLVVEYNNTVIQSVNGNNYLTNGIRTAFSTPTGSTTTDKNALIVSVSGVTQNQDAFTFPSVTLAYSGVDLPFAPSPSDSVSIRMLDTGSTIYTRKTTMADRRPDKGFSYMSEFSVKRIESISGFERTRLLSRRPKRSWDLSYTNITGVEKEAVQSFYNSRSGSYDSFIFDLDHINEQGSAIVRFDASIDMSHVLSAAAQDLYRNIWTIKFKLKEI